MTGKKLAFLAAMLAGAAVLTWTVVEMLGDPPVAQRTAEDDALADSPIARMVARVGPPDPAAGAAAWAARDGWGWEGWRRAAAELRAAGDMSGNSDGELGYLRGRSFWDGDPDLDSAVGRRRGVSGIAAARAGGAGERAVRGHPYRSPRTGKPTIRTSGRRLGRPDMRLPHGAVVTLGLDDDERIPIRVEVCVNRAGRPQEVEVVEGTGFDAVDNYVAGEMLAGRYRPLRQDGRRVAFCERTTVILGR